MRPPAIVLAALVGTLALRCSSTTTDTSVAADASLDVATPVDVATPIDVPLPDVPLPDASPADAPADVPPVDVPPVDVPPVDVPPVDVPDAPPADVASADVPTEPPVFCGGVRVLDLDRVGVVTAYGLGATVDLRGAPERVLPTTDPSCPWLYRPVVVRLRAPADGRLFVAGLGYALAVQRVTRCEPSAPRLSCHPVELISTTANVSGWFLDEVRAGEVVDLAVGIAHDPGAASIPGRPREAPVFVSVAPALSLGASCRYSNTPHVAGVCASGLACALDAPGSTGRCVSAGTPKRPCGDGFAACGEGLSCGRYGCAPTVLPGAACDPAERVGVCLPLTSCAWLPVCPPSSDCVRLGAEARCAPVGQVGGRCRPLAGSSPRCDPGLRCRLTRDLGERCETSSVGSNECDGSQPCPSGSACDDGVPSRCRTVGTLQGFCRVTNAGRLCDDGLVCARAGRFCVPALAEGAACAVTRDDAAECGPNLFCGGGRCARAGLSGAPCGADALAADCQAPLMCIDGRCAAGPAEGERCASEGRCPSGMRCYDFVCRRTGVLGRDCRPAEPRCDEGLACNARGLCGPVTPPGSACVDSTDCTAPLRCVALPLLDTSACYPSNRCADGCAEGETCLDGQCSAAGRCDRPDQRSGASPCGEGRYCVSVALDRIECLPEGALRGRCRRSGPTLCDDGLFCSQYRCVRPRGEGEPCHAYALLDGTCGAGLRCVTPPDRYDGTCQRPAVAGAVGGDCVRAPDGTARCDAPLACDDNTLRCRVATPAGERCDGSSPCAPGTRCVYDVARLRRSCLAAGGAGQPCRPDLLHRCDDGLACRGPDERCLP